MFACGRCVAFHGKGGSYGQWVFGFSFSLRISRFHSVSIYVFIYLHLSIYPSTCSSLSLSLSVYIYIYIYVCVCLCVSVSCVWHAQKGLDGLSRRDYMSLQDVIKGGSELTLQEHSPHLFTVVALLAVQIHSYIYTYIYIYIYIYTYIHTSTIIFINAHIFHILRMHEFHCIYGCW